MALPVGRFGSVKWMVLKSTSIYSCRDMHAGNSQPNRDRVAGFLLHCKHIFTDSAFYLYLMVSSRSVRALCRASMLELMSSRFLSMSPVSVVL